MSEANTETTHHWEPILPEQRRVLGVLIEKQKTAKTGDTYPMTLNSITTGCNQKSNRDPVTDFDEYEVDQFLEALHKRGLVVRISGTRTDRWKHMLYEHWKIAKVEMAIMAELLLRGAQTEGELRTRASRMDEVGDLDQLRQLLDPLVERKLVVYLTPRDRRGAMLTHGFLLPEELELETARHAGSGGEVEVSRARPLSPAPRQDNAVADLQSEVAELRAQLQRLEARLDQAGIPRGPE